MPQYNVYYEVRMKATVEAKDEAEAREIALSGEVDFTEDEITSDTWVFEK